MGLPQRKLYVTNLGDKFKMVLLSAWIPPKHEDGIYYHPKDIPIGLDMFIPNVLNVKYEDGPVPVKIVKSDKVTGLWVVCYDDYFGNEIHLYNYKPQFNRELQKIDYEYEEELNEKSKYELWSMHVYMENSDMIAGDGPIPVTLEIGHPEEPIYKHPKRESFIKKFFKRK